MKLHSAQKLLPCYPLVPNKAPHFTLIMTINSVFNTAERKRAFLRDKTQVRSSLSILYLLLPLFVCSLLALQITAFAAAYNDKNGANQSSVSRQRQTAKSNALLRGHSPSDQKILKKDLPHILHGSLYTSQTHKQHTWFSYHGGNFPLTYLWFISPNPHRNLSTFLHCHQGIFTMSIKLAPHSVLPSRLNFLAKKIHYKSSFV